MSDDDLLSLALENDERAWRRGLLLVLSSIETKITTACQNMVTHEELDEHCVKVHSKLLPPAPPASGRPALALEFGRVKIKAQHLAGAVVVMAAGIVLVVVLGYLGWLPRREAAESKIADVRAHLTETGKAQ